METSLSLIERVRDPGDSVSWRRLVELYTPLIRGWLRRGVEGADEDDLIQEVLVAVMGAMPSFVHSGRPGAFRHWLRTTTAYQLSAFWKSRKSRRTTQPFDWDQLHEAQSDLSRAWDQEHDEFVARRLLALIEPEFSPSTWLAFKRQVLDGQKAAVVAAELGTSVNAVLLAKSRVLARFRLEGRGLID
jgi:RNA polymerase sigma-70 factor (ECF subfamily)